MSKSNIAHVEWEFRAAWNSGVPVAEIAETHGYANTNSVRRVARRLGLIKRTKSSAHELTGGEWVWDPKRGVRVWEAHS